MQWTPDTLNDLIHLGAVVLRNVLFFLLWATASECFEESTWGQGSKYLPVYTFLIRSENDFLGLVHLLCLLSFFGCVLVSDLVECCKKCPLDCR